MEIYNFTKKIQMTQYLISNNKINNLKSDFRYSCLDKIQYNMEYILNKTDEERFANNNFIDKNQISKISSNHDTIRIIMIDGEIFKIFHHSDTNTIEVSYKNRRKILITANSNPYDSEKLFKQIVYSTIDYNSIKTDLVFSHYINLAENSDLKKVFDELFNKASEIAYMFDGISLEMVTQRLLDYEISLNYLYNDCIKLVNEKYDKVFTKPNVTIPILSDSDSIINFGYQWVNYGLSIQKNFTFDIFHSIFTTKCNYLNDIIRTKLSEKIHYKYQEYNFSVLEDLLYEIDNELVLSNITNVFFTYMEKLEKLIKQFKSINTLF
jgi:hypothetical protein